MDCRNGWKEYDKLRIYPKGDKNAAWNFEDFMLRFLRVSAFEMKANIVLIGNKSVEGQQKNNLNC